MGAVHIVVPGNFPIGCMPSYLATFGRLVRKNAGAFDELKCLKSLNIFSMFHNERLQASLAELRHVYPDVQIMYADYYHAFLHILENAPLYGK